MKILLIFALLGLIASISMASVFLNSATAQPNDNNLTRATSAPPLEGNLTTDLGSNQSNATIPATDGNEYR